MSAGSVTLAIDGPVARIVFDRPAARNAMTRDMYGDLHDICHDLAGRREVRIAVLRGAGGASFVAGSDIGIFTDVVTGADGITYEREMEAHIAALEMLPIPTLAVVEGWAVGGGLSLAAVCDFRIATPDTRFGVPIARTVGNCLSMANHARLIDGFGAARAKRMVMLGEMIDAAEARDAGFLVDVVDPAELGDRIAEICERVLGNAPVTMRVTKQAINLVLASRRSDEVERLISEAYGSADFRRGTAAFLLRQKPEWRGD